MTDTSLILHQWHFTAAHTGVTPVLPDGCRDLIVQTDASAEPKWFVSSLAQTTQQVPCQAGQIFSGFRFHPAARIDETNLLNAFRAFGGGESKGQLVAQLEEYVHLDNNLADALEGLANARQMRETARHLGVSERTLERLVKKATGQTPMFWKSLARARQAARQLDPGQPLAELAADSGYADQAHMTREFRKWFGVTPRHLLQSAELAALVQASGYG